MEASEWRSRKARHEGRVDTWIRPHLSRRQRGVSHPVEDFLFTYYSYRPSALRRWHPGIGVTVTGGGVEAFAALKGYIVTGQEAYVDPGEAGRRNPEVTAIRKLLTATASRPPQLRCFGLHEWAMVYRQSAEEVRHPAYPLRLGAEGTADVVESHRLTCTHYDAFRFFTASARPRNAVQPTRQTRADLEQPGCLHATMDLYKHAYRLVPLVSSDLVADCFELARDIRVLDMRASPYDLSALGYSPVPVETSAGKQSYVSAQRAFAERGAVLRARLIDACERLCGQDSSVSR
jgi:hypothetical protein